MARLGGASFRFSFFDEQVGDFHQVVGQHRGADQQLETFAALGQTAFHTTPAEKDGDASLDAGPETLAFLEGRSFLVGLTFGRFLAPALRDALAGHAGLVTGVLVVGVVEAAIGGKEMGSKTEHIPMTFQ